MGGRVSKLRGEAESARKHYDAMKGVGSEVEKKAAKEAYYAKRALFNTANEEYEAKFGGDEGDADGEHVEQSRGASKAPSRTGSSTKDNTPRPIARMPSIGASNLLDEIMNAPLSPNPTAIVVPKNTKNLTVSIVSKLMFC